MEDLLKGLSDLYINGEVSKFSEFLLANDASYDALGPTQDINTAFVNYIDSCFFGSYFDIFQTNVVLTQFLIRQPLQKEIDLVLTWLECDKDFAAAALKIAPETVLSPFQKQLFESVQTKKEIDKPSSYAPRYQEWFKAQQAMLKGWFIAHKTRAEFLKLNETKNIPYPLPYFFPKKPQTIHENLSFLDEPALYIFDSMIHFKHSLRFEEIHQILSNRENGLYILDLYPNLQLKCQQDLQKLPKVFLSPHSLIQESIPFLTQALNDVLRQPPTVYESDTPTGDILYQSAKRLLYVINQHRLGKKRVPGLLEKTNITKWHDPHKGIVPSELLVKIPSKDLFLEILDELRSRRVAIKNRSIKKPLKMTHIVPQLVDGQHAPSRLLSELISFHDPEQFQVDLIITERIMERPLDYPLTTYTSPPSSERGLQRIEIFKNSGVNVKIHKPLNTLLKEAELVSQELNSQGTDIAVFHGMDVINTMATQLTAAPLRILFEHGTATPYSGFDLMIASSMDAKQIYGEQFKKLNTSIETLPFHVDVRKNWPKEPTKLKDLNLPDHALVMTTISGNLFNRLGPNMCAAISAILKRVPNSYYAPIGSISDNDKEKLLSYFKKDEVDNRVKFLGFSECPGQWARCMKLYLNEFPFGSCLGMLDSMAAGCAVVSMHDPSGPSQARYGADFLGIERTIPKGDIKGYIDLACNLLTDPSLFNEWSQHSLKQYEKHSNEKEYVAQFEKIVAKYASSS